MTTSPSSTPSPSLRVEPAPSRGTAQNLLYDLQQLTYHLSDENPSTRILRRPLSMEEGVKVPGGASENYKRMGRFSSMVYYHLIGDHTNYTKFRTQTLNYIREERTTRGHMGGEQGCSQPHDGMHLAATFLAHLHGTITSDIDLLQETGWWIGGYLSICRACYHPSYNRIAIPGFRIKSTPLSEVRDLIYQRCVQNLEPVAMDLPSNDKINWQRFYLAVKLAFKLKSMGAMPKPSGAVPKLYAPMTVQKKTNGIVASLTIPERTKGKSETVSWVQIADGEMTYGRPEGVTIDKEPKRRRKEK